MRKIISKVLFSHLAKRVVARYLEDFILNTSNPNKMKEFEKFGLGDIETRDFNLREPEGTPMEVIRSKSTQLGEKVIVEDTSLDVKGADIGVNIKWKSDTLDEHIGKEAKITILLAVMINERIEVYAGVVEGKLVSPRGDEDWGFAPYFLPNGATKTLGEEKPDKYNARSLVVKKFLDRAPDYYVEPLVWKGEWQKEADMSNGILPTNQNRQKDTRGQFRTELKKKYNRTKGKQKPKSKRRNRIERRKNPRQKYEERAEDNPERVERKPSGGSRGWSEYNKDKDWSEDNRQRKKEKAKWEESAKGKKTRKNQKRK